MFGVIAFVLAQIVTTAPAPTPPKTIVHVRTSLLCSTLRDNIFHSIEGLRLNDNQIKQGRLVLARMSEDSIGSYSWLPRAISPRRQRAADLTNAALQMGNYQLGNIVNSIAQNLRKIDALLDDQKRFPDKPKSDDDAALDFAKLQLESVADQQRLALNILSGSVETTALQSLAKGDNIAGENPIVGSTEPAQNNVSSTSTSPGAMRTTLFTSNAYGQLAIATFAQEGVTKSFEDGVPPAIVPIINACR